MSNLEFIWIITQAFWPLSIAAGIAWVMIIHSIITSIKNRKGKYIYEKRGT